MIKLVSSLVYYLLISKLMYLIYHLNFPIPLNILQKVVFKLLYCIPFGKRLGHMQKIITVVQTKYKFIFLTHKRSPEVDSSSLKLVEQLHKVCKLPNRDIVWSYEGLRERKRAFGSACNGVAHLIESGCLCHFWDVVFSLTNQDGP